MPGNVTELRGNFTDVVAIHELRGDYPNIPIASDIDYSALTAGDADPMFISLPIGKANVTSGNHRFYDEAWLQELERQVLANRPIGLIGHLSTEQRGWAMPPEALHWVGAVRDAENVLWGKAYVVPGETRQRLARYKAQNKSIATSIDAVAEGVWDEQIKAYRMKASTLKLGQIDLAPSDRAGIPDLSAVPHFTSEMASDDQAVEEQEPEMGKLEVINELTAEDARLLPKPVREAILAEVPAAPEVAVVQELRQALGADEKADLTKLVKELRQAQDESRKAAVSGRIKELVEDKDKGIKIEAVRGLVTELVNARNPQTPGEAETAYTAVVEMQSVKDTLAAALQTTMGPPQRSQVQPQHPEGSRGHQYFSYPKEKEA